jgi:hypothetical protein
MLVEIYAENAFPTVLSVAAAVDYEDMICAEPRKRVLLVGSSVVSQRINAFLST